MTEKPVILFRVDASSGIGIGHLMRCIAMAQALQHLGARPLFVTRKLDGLSEKILSSFQFTPEFIDDELTEAGNAASTAEIACREKAPLLIVDHYDLGETFRSIIRETGRSLLVIDDIAVSPSITADIILNQNCGAGNLLPRYRSIAPETTTFLIGEEYVMLRDDILEKGTGIRKERPDRLESIASGDIKPDIMIIYGGSDVKQLTPLTLEVMRDFRDDYGELFVVIGPGMTDQDLLERVKQAAGDLPRTRLLYNPDLAEYMARVDLAITAGGSTTHELAFFGVAMIICQVADNQDVICNGFGSKDLAGIVRMGSDYRDALSREIRNMFKTPEKIKTLSLAGMKLIDGHGRERIASILARLYFS